MVHDMYLMQVKTPAESKYPWDYYKVVATIPGDQAFTTKAETSALPGSKRRLMCGARSNRAPFFLCLSGASRMT